MAKTRARRPLVVTPGTVFSFRTSAYYECSPAETGRYGALVVLGHNSEIVAIGVLDGVWTAPPTPAMVEGCGLLRLNRDHFNDLPAEFACGVNDAPELEEFTEVTVLALTPEQQAIAQALLDPFNLAVSFQSPYGASVAVEGEWRWQHDREAFLREDQIDQGIQDDARIAADQDYAARLASLTWADLIAETKFARWESSPPFPPAAFRDAAAERFRDAVRAAQALGTPTDAAAVREILRDLTHWFNEADERAGWVIETEEREDISIAMAELAHVAQHPELIDEVDQWRSW